MSEKAMKLSCELGGGGVGDRRMEDGRFPANCLAWFWEGDGRVPPLPAGEFVEFGRLKLAESISALSDFSSLGDKLPQHRNAQTQPVISAVFKVSGKV